MAYRTCTFEGCDKPYDGRGLCSGHLSQLKRHGHCWPISPRSWPERFWFKVDKTETCWLWTAAVDKDGYGSVGIPGSRTALAHRVAYELVVGPIPGKLTIDHLCRVRNCVNPDHLEAVTMRENVLRGMAPTAQNHRLTHCHRGHPFDEENTRWSTSQWGTQHRNCRACARQKYRRLRKVASNGNSPGSLAG